MPVSEPAGGWNSRGSPLSDFPRWRTAPDRAGDNLANAHQLIEPLFQRPVSGLATSRSVTRRKAWPNRKVAVRSAASRRWTRQNSEKSQAKAAGPVMAAGAKAQGPSPSKNGVEIGRWGGGDFVRRCSARVTAGNRAAIRSLAGRNVSIRSQIPRQGQRRGGGRRHSRGASLFSPAPMG